MEQYIYRFIIHPFYHNIIKYNKYYEYLDLYRHTQYISERNIVDLQSERLVKLLNHAYNNTEYYKSLLNNRGINLNDINTLHDLRIIPFLTKDLIKKNLKSITANNITRRRFIPNSTSGSTGENLKFYSDKLGDLHRAVLQVRMDEWVGLEIGCKKIFIWGSRFDLRKSRKLLNAIKSRIKNLKMLSGYLLNDEKLYSHFKIIEEFKPALISGYPSTLELFSNFIINNDLEYKPVAVRTEGETLYDYQREKIKKALNSPVFNYYSSRDITGIAHECKQHNGLHILSENVILEVIDENGNPIEEGEGEVVLTDLHNYVMPFIRYKIGDRAVVTKRKCECGINLPLIDKVEGRTFDLVKFPNCNKVSGTFWTLLLKSKPGIDNFQVKQQNDGSITINIVKNRYYSIDSEKYIIAKIKEFGGHNTNIEISYVDFIPLTNSGKKRFVISEYSL